MIETKFLAPTNARGARIAARSASTRIVVDWKDSADQQANHNRAALALATKLGWSGSLVRACRLDDKGFIYVRYVPTLALRIQPGVVS